MGKENGHWWISEMIVAEGLLMQESTNSEYMKVLGFLVFLSLNRLVVGKKNWWISEVIYEGLLTLDSCKND